jgi:hypothetical protein
MNLFKDIPSHPPEGDHNNMSLHYDADDDAITTNKSFSSLSHTSEYAL